MFLLRKIFVSFYNFRTMSEQGEYVGGWPFGRSHPPLVPLDAGPGHQAQHSPSGLCAPGPSGRGGAAACRCPPHPQDPENSGPRGHGPGPETLSISSTVNEAQGLIDRANEEARALQREKDGAGWYDARAQPPGPLASLSEMPTPFEFGGFRSGPPFVQGHSYRVPSPSSSSSFPLPTHGVWLCGGVSSLRPRS